MNSLMGYGSDDDCDSSSNDNTRGEGPAGGPGNKPLDGRSPDANYEEVQMDLSEDTSNSSDDRTPPLAPRKPREEVLEQQRESSYSTKKKERDDSKSGRKRERDRDSHHDKDKDRERDRERDRDHERSRRNSSREHERERDRDYEKDRNHDKDSDYERDRDHDRDRQKHRSSRHEKSSSRRDRDKTERTKERGDHRDKDRGEKERRGSKDSRRSRSPPSRRESKYERSRSRSKERLGYVDRKFSKRYERTSHKMSQLDKMGIAIKTPDCQYVSPLDLQKSMEEEKRDHFEGGGGNFGVGVAPVGGGNGGDRFFVPGITGRFREQIERRKLLWQKKEPEAVVVENKQQQRSFVQSTPAASNPAASRTTKVWEATTFAQDTDGKVANKFKRLMGIRNNSETAGAPSDVLKKQEEMFSSMEQQYEVARTATHTMRGVGLGFGSFQR